MRTVLMVVAIIGLSAAIDAADVPVILERGLPADEVVASPLTFRASAGASRDFIWWLPAGAEDYVLPIGPGVVVETVDQALMDRLKAESPWDLKMLPILGARYGGRMLVVIVPWPHYAELIIGNRLGVHFSFPPGRNNTTPCDVVAQWAGPDPLEAARVFREWRKTASDRGGVPRARPLSEKAKDLPQLTRLFGAAHFYLWGPAMFSRHDVDRARWIPLAHAVRDAPSGSTRARLRSRFTDEEEQALQALANAEYPERPLVTVVAGAIDRALSDPTLLGERDGTSLRNVVESNRAALAEGLSGFVHDPRSWGDGPSLTLLEAMHDAGVQRGLFLLSDLYGQSVRPDIAARAAEFGFLLGPYDSYHTVHSPDAQPNQTWETAQFDQAAFTRGRVLDAEGRGSAGFRGRGFHFSPIAARPYLERRVGAVLGHNDYSAWFIDCDATAECFDDFHPDHPATRVEDINERRRRLRWLERDQRLVIGSEGGSVLFSDVIHFGHGLQTPYIGHLDPAFRDRKSPHFLGRYWPTDTPENAFKPVPVPPSLLSPYFDPRVLIPLYRAAVGDEIIATHHWSFDSLKLSGVAGVRQLLEILYQVPPMYHLNRETWLQRRDRIMQVLAVLEPAESGTRRGGARPLRMADPGPDAPANDVSDPIR